MFWVFPYWQEVFGATYEYLSEIVNDTISYNGFWLQNENIIISKIDFDNSHRIQSDTYYKPLIDGAGELNYFFREKIVNASWYMKAESEETMNNEIDRLKKILLQNQKDLIIKVNGNPRVAKASLINGDSLFDREHFHITFLPFTLQFRVLEKFRDITAQNYLVSWQTADFIEEIYNGGSAKVEPIITFVFNSASGVNEISFVYNGNTITINETIATSDILIIDSREKKVTLNDVEVDYTGIFPIFETGLQSYEVQVNGTKNFDTNIKFFNTYL